MMSTEQRAEIRQRWETYQDQLTTSASAGGGDALAVGDTPVQGVIPLLHPLCFLLRSPHYLLILTVRAINPIVRVFLHGRSIMPPLRDLFSARNFSRTQPL